MTSPAKRKKVDPFEPKVRKANWLGRYLAVERKHDAELSKVLKDAAADTYEKLLKLPDDDKISTAVRKAQYKAAIKEIHTTLRDTFGFAGDTIRSGQRSVAIAAVEARMYEDASLLARLLPNKKDRDDYAASLKQTAQRNIEAVMHRVLLTEQPLSRRVYKTRTLSNGLVSRTVNRGLARGDSAADIARAVSGLIRPDVPGGVSYAAKRLARTEINNAFHAQSIKDIQDTPWLNEVEWNLSQTHEPQNCVCEVYAQTKVFPVDKVPVKPHPQCRCYVTGRRVSPEEFEDRLISGEYNEYIDKRLGLKSGTTKPEEMVPAPKEDKTTKAAQPEGWTGPPVAKSAANKEVRGAVEDTWGYASRNPVALQAMRIGARKVQVDGYRGGLSAPDKKLLLERMGSAGTGEWDDPKVLTAIGRELTARQAYAEPSAVKLYTTTNLDSESVERLLGGQDRQVVSIPLSRFDAHTGQSIRMADTTKHGETVLFEVQPGARLAEAGDTWAGLGQYEVVGTPSRFEHDGKTLVRVRVKQVDTREFEAPTDEKDIPDLVFSNVDGTAFNTATKVSTTKKVVAERKWALNPKEDSMDLTGDTLHKSLKTHDEFMAAIQDVDKDERAKRSGGYAQVMSDTWPNLKVHGWDDVSVRPNPDTTRDIMLEIDKQLRQFPNATLTELTQTNLERLYDDSRFDRSYAVTDYNRGPWGTSAIIVNDKWASAATSSMIQSTMRGESTGFHVPGSGPAGMRGIIIHEFGHVLDHTTSKRTRTESYRAVHEVFQDAVGVEPLPQKVLVKSAAKYTKAEKALFDSYTDKYENWISAQEVSTYSRKKSDHYGDSGDDLNLPEAIAEAFTDVELNGRDTVEPIVGMLYDILTKHYLSGKWLHGL